ncbi:putative glycerophosphocholine phosphodiesterase GPCPD1 homolog 2 [Dreissena polymorpha]|uniref:Glycerophosphocholine phosphodiesterase GPCPD1 n=1 Tax=Dreissena polymorpha TaxID=45954 RepID=A0A9D4KDZ0_DREPO|nr:putative glycerophosphocholine phosphodiesterase GPCPD1 homolog 2 [Dreissena polymorpha]XP_052277088.1 putative glycerophosphocholine phosphodiesterase GPCPD1 homolog 2 [Dreissena polymorpha]XP_052277089.1 putative glycerophosphocholine phosphodiesterase GPCPD1 homolog 2 [Dreissena polymorpha]XP_052277090.1 putative glycerophosphocholine phosphodiesterase GPCPD1 homolog 2 [Dreissena polymorpha]XP_052277091.1 putative glycerophosphocholine phosphodiesterase GPCPD1 homolog 2 [Dreissena polymor
MLCSLTYEVLFRVRVETYPDEVVCVTGDLPELGNWQTHGGMKLKRETRRKNSSGDKTSAANVKGDVWSLKLKFTDYRDTIKYRYFVARFPVEDEDQTVVITRWETNIKPRIFFIAEAMSGVDYQEEISLFGDYGGKKHVTQGWLTDQSQINIHLHGNPLTIWNAKYLDRMISVKCTPIDLRFRAVQNADDRDNLLIASYAVVNVVKLEKGKSKARFQDEFGVMLTPHTNISFEIQTLDPEHTAFQLEFFLHETQSKGPSAPKYFAYSFILPLDLHTSTETRIVPISGLKHLPIGQITCDYLLIKPLKGFNASLEVSYQKHWNWSRQPLDIGHRGMGVSYSNKCKMPASTRENTVKSLVDAANHGADYVEFDVHLTKDKQVIVYHDFKVHIAYRKKLHGELGLLEVPVKDLKLSELQQMKLLPHATVKDLEEISRDDLDPEDLQPFPTLAQCLQAVDINTGFNIEIKYPQWLKDNNVHEQEHYFDMNEFTDAILLEVFKYHGGRRIVFTSFDCNTCIMLRLKQNVFPVMFLTQGDTIVYDWYRDHRTHSVVMAAEFAIAHDLLGVNAMSELLLKDPGLITYVKDSGLVLWTWGEDNNDSNTIKRLKQLGLNAVIYDRIDLLKTTGKESVFKLEKIRKKMKKMNFNNNVSVLKDKPSELEENPIELKDKPSELNNKPIILELASTSKDVNMPATASSGQ